MCPPRSPAQPGQHDRGGRSQVETLRTHVDTMNVNIRLAIAHGQYLIAHGESHPANGRPVTTCASEATGDNQTFSSRSIDIACPGRRSPLHAASAPSPSSIGWPNDGQRSIQRLVVAPRRPVMFRTKGRSTGRSQQGTAGRDEPITTWSSGRRLVPPACGSRSRSGTCRWRPLRGATASRRAPPC